MKLWNRWTTRAAGLPGDEGEPAGALADSLRRLAADVRAETLPIDADAAWRRVEMGIARGERGAHRLTRRWAPAMALIVIACALGLSLWSRTTRSGLPASELRPVRLDVALWETNLSAGPPLGDATRELTRILEPSLERRERDESDATRQSVRSLPHAE
jgi:hypothetical protein